MSITLYGANLSPFVRKVRMALEYRNLDYELVPVIPNADDKPAEFVANSPLGKIPLAKIDNLWLPDSSVILAYLERAHSDQPLLSDDPAQAARALWYEAYAGSHMTSVIGGHLFAELILAPLLFKRESNKEEIELAKSQEIPAIFDYLESQLHSDYLVGDTLGHADICVGSPLVTLQHCNVECDASRWPKTAAYIKRFTSDPAFADIINEEKNFLAAIGA